MIAHSTWLKTFFGTLMLAVLALGCTTPHPPQLATPAHKPTLYLVGDSTLKTGSNEGETGPWGWASEIDAMFDTSRIQIVNEGRGGRSSRGYIEEGAWATVLAKVAAGDYVIIQFGHNDTKNSQNYPDRITLPGNGDEAKTITSPVTQQPKEIHSYGWYLRQYIRDAQARGATVIICSPVPRNQWAGGKIKRGFDGYAQWAREAAAQGNALFIDLNALAVERYDALGQQAAAEYFNDVQHTNKNGARLNAECVVTGIRKLKGCALEEYLLPAAR